MAHDPDLTSPAADPPTDSFDAGLAAAFGPDLTPGGFTQPPLLRDDPSDPGLVRPSSAAMPAGSSERYQLLGEIARGGMGVVLKGRDPDLGRDLAFKVLRAELAGKPAAVQRFVEEAQVGGQLQHPGVVPVYDLGRFADGRPYFAMKLVKGRTLADHLAARPAPAADRGRFLQVFLQVCQAVAYAHSKGVVHRDLKPANVMVGAFGEVLVMDWGLAKVLPRGGLADEEKATQANRDRKGAGEEEPTVIHTARSGSGAGSETQAGSVMGTPAFMPPEQAGGEIDKLDERADVFGLGAVLCVILTGQPPYVGDTGDAVRLLAIRGKLDDAVTRLDSSAADADLIALCKRCLSVERDDRPRHAGEVTAAVQRHLANVEERARKAEVDRAAAEARAEEEVKTRKMAEAKTMEERRRRRTQLALLAMTAVVSVSLVSGWLWLRGERLAKQARARQLVETLLDRAETELTAERVSEATAALAQAEPHLSDTGSPELAERYAQDVKDRNMVKELEAIFEEHWKLRWGSFQYGEAFERTSQRYAAAFSGYGVVVNHQAAGPTAVATQRSSISAALVASLNYWFFLDEHDTELQEVLALADADPTRCAIRDEMANKNFDMLETRVAATDWIAMPLWFTVALGGRDVLGDDVAIRIMKQAWTTHPSSYALARRIGERLIWHGGERAQKERRNLEWEAVSWFRAAVALQPQSAGAYRGLGNALVQASGFNGEVLPILRTAAVLNPLDLDTRAILVLYYWRNKDRPRMIAAYREAMRLHDRKDAESEGYGYGAMAMAANDHFVPLLCQEGHCQLALQVAREFMGKEATKTALPKELNFSSARYNAACAAMLCAVGKGTDCPPASERPALRGEALGYLKLDLVMWRKGFESNPNQHRAEVHRTVGHWLRDRDRDLAPVRGVFAVLALPPVERADWLAFWAEVRKLRDETMPEVLPPPRAVK